MVVSSLDVNEFVQNGWISLTSFKPLRWVSKSRIVTDWLNLNFAPGDLVFPTQYIDRTKSIRAHTFCGNGLVGHVSLAHPVSKVLIEIAKKMAPRLEFKCHFDATYLCIEGPTFSTQAESLSYISMGASIIGMTNFPEYALAREAGLAYLPACFVTD